MVLCVPAALWCNCTIAQCEKNDYRCETDGACMASTTLIDGKEQHTRWCIPQISLEPLGQPIYCRGAEGLVNNHCCYTDYCNSIDLKLPSGTHWSTHNQPFWTIICFLFLVL